MPELAATEPLAALADLHFLRPWGLLLLPLGAVLYLWLRRQRDVARRLRGLVAPHLLKHLLLPGGVGERFRPEHLLLAILVLGGIALAGPTHEREVPPFVDDQAALVLAVDVSSTMNAIDVAPTRLERAKQKVRDLLGRRPGARTGLIAYAGSAHVVLPLTEDAGILETYVDALATAMMPVEGDRPDEALSLAQSLLTDASAPGSILFLADGIPARARSAFAAHQGQGGAPVLLLALATERGGPVKTGRDAFATDNDGNRLVSRLDAGGLDATSGLWWTGVTVDHSDVDRVLGKVERHLAATQAADERWQWKDLGSLFLWPLMLLVPLWFRRGWTVRWAAALLLAAAFVAGEPAHAHDSVWQRLWRTPDQQGRRHFERGEYEDAAAHFLAPMWKGVSLYRAGLYEQAVDQFALLDTPDAFFNLGNTYARMKRWKRAIASYEQVLKRRPDSDDAKANLDLVEQMLAYEEAKKDDEEPQEGGDTLGADEIVVDDGSDDRKRPEGEETVFGGGMEEGMEELWMRQVQTTPAAFLAGKFAIQAQERKEGDR